MSTRKPPSCNIVFFLWPWSSSKLEKEQHREQTDGVPCWWGWAGASGEKHTQPLAASSFPFICTAARSPPHFYLLFGCLGFFFSLLLSFFPSLSFLLFTHSLSRVSCIITHGLIALQHAGICKTTIHSSFNRKNKKSPKKTQAGEEMYRFERSEGRKSEFSSAA